MSKAPDPEISGPDGVPSLRSRAFGLSKSRITAFEQCPLKLWLLIRRPELAEADEGAEIRFAAGHEVGEIACRLHPDGIMIEADPDLAAALRRTREYIEQGGPEPLFEATFEHDGVLVRVDILVRDQAGVRLFEVKSSSGVKDYHLGDLATQVWVVREAGLKVRSAAIRHINSAFRLKREGDYEGLFADAELIAELEGLIAERPALVAAARAVLAQEEPVVATGEHCSRPFACEFWTYCTRHDPPGPDWPVNLLPRTGRTVAAEWASRGVLDLRDVPASELKSPQHERIRQATVTGEVYHDLKGAIRDTADWAWPRAYLDFETIAPAVPRWVGTGPYQQIPFQFSCHIEEQTGELGHSGFLSLDGADPRRGCAEALVAALGGDRCGTIIAYNAAFERRCVLDLAEAFVDLAPDLRALAARIVDLLPVTRNHYYHRDQRGSWSIKAVLPTVAPELAYDDLQVKDGGAAQIAWFEAANPYTDDKRRAELRAGLEAYCERDTWAMVVLLRRLTGG